MSSSHSSKTIEKNRKRIALMNLKIQKADAFIDKHKDNANMSLSVKKQMSDMKKWRSRSVRDRTAAEKSLQQQEDKIMKDPESMVRVDITWTIKVVYKARGKGKLRKAGKDSETSTRTIKESAECKNNPAAIAALMRQKYFDLEDSISRYQFPGYETDCKFLSGVINGHHPDYSIDLVNGKLGTETHTIHHIFGDPVVIANAVAAPSIEGYHSYDDPEYGCVVATLYEILKSHFRGKSSMTKEEIYALVGANQSTDLRSCANPVDEEIDEMLEEDLDEKGLCPLDPVDEDSLKPISSYTGVKREPLIGVPLENIVAFLEDRKTYFKSIISLPLQTPIIIGADAPDSHQQTIRLYFDNKHLYVENKEEAAVHKINVSQLETIVYELDGSDASIDQMLDTHYKPKDVCIHLRLEPASKNEVISLDRVLHRIYVKYNHLPKIELDGSAIVKILSEGVVISHGNGYNDRKAIWNFIVNYCCLQDMPVPFEFCEWNDQSAAVMASTLFDVKIPAPTPSFDSIYDRELINKFYTKPAVMAANPVVNFENEAIKGRPHFTLDLKAAYLNVVKSSRGKKLPIFTSLDNFIAVDLGVKGVEPLAEYLVDSFWCHGFRMEPMILNGYTVQELMKLGLINSSHLLMIRRPSSWYSADHLIDFADILDQIFNVHETDDSFKLLKGVHPVTARKMLYTSWIGSLGMRSHKSSNGIVTTDQEHLRGVKSRLIEGDLSLMYRSETTEKFENNGPIFRYIVGSGMVMLLKLIKELVAAVPDVHLISTRVDCIQGVVPKGTCPLNPEITNEEAFNKFVTSLEKRAKLEDKPIFLGLGKEKPIIDGFQYADPRDLFVPPKDILTCRDVSKEDGWYECGFSLNQYDYLQKIEQAPRELINAIAGAGKSRQMAKQAVELREKIPGAAIWNMAITRVVCNAMHEGIKTPGVDPLTESMTFAKYEVLRKSDNINCRKKIVKLMERVKQINIDEFSMMDASAWNELNLLIYKFYKLFGACPRISVYGDGNQIPPVKCNVYDVKNLPMVKRLFGNFKTIEYDPDSDPRYNQRTKDALDVFLKTGSISGTPFMDRVMSYKAALELSDKRSLCYRHKVREAVTKKKRELGLEASDGTETFVMLRTVTIKRCRGSEPRDETVIVKGSKGEDIKMKKGMIISNSEIVTRAMLNAIKSPALKEGKGGDYVSTLCMTGHKAQGETIDAPYTVFVEPDDTRNAIYVKLSRIRGDLSRITIAAPDGWSVERLIKHVFEWDSTFHIKEDKGLLNIGYIYLMKQDLSTVRNEPALDSNKSYYIGKTDNPARRNREHHMPTVHKNGSVIPAKFTDATMHILYSIGIAHNPNRLTRVETWTIQNRDEIIGWHGIDDTWKILNKQNALMGAQDRRSVHKGANPVADRDPSDYELETEVDIEIDVEENPIDIDAITDVETLLMLFNKELDALMSKKPCHIKFNEARNAFTWKKLIAGVQKQLQSNVDTHGSKLAALKDIMKKVREVLSMH